MHYFLCTLSTDGVFAAAFMAIVQSSNQVLFYWSISVFVDRCSLGAMGETEVARKCESGEGDAQYGSL
jgi:hypothetical protein